MTTATTPLRPHETLTSPTVLPLAIAAITLVTLGAYENRAVVTVLPLVTRELDGIQWFGLASGISSLTFLVATALAGALADRHGPRRVIVTGIATFVLAQAVTGLATSMPALLTGRAVSGVAEGLLDIGLVVLMAEAVPEHLRAKVFATFAAAWVLPSLLGPVVAGTVAELWGWRAVFVTPLVLLAVAVVALLPSLRGAGAGHGRGWTPEQRARLVAAALVATAVGALTWGTAAWTTSRWGAPAAAGGVVVLALAWRHSSPAAPRRCCPASPRPSGSSSS